MEIANLVFYSIYSLLALTLMMLTHRNVRNAGDPVSKLTYSLLSYGASNLVFAFVPAYGIPAIVLGNFLLTSTGVYMLLIYREWRTGSKFVHESYVWIALGCVIAYLTYLQYNGTFTHRVLFMTCVAFLLYAWSALELLRNKKPDGQFQRRLLLGVIGLSLLMLTARLYAIANQIGGQSTSFQSESIVTFGMAWSWNTLILLNNLLIASYYIDKMWHEELRLSNELSAQKKLVSELEYEIQNSEKINARLTELLGEKNNLLKRLSMAEKTGMLGALAGSLAHELNQPLCATKLNLDTLKQVAADQPEAKLLMELLSELENDNLRVEKIVKRVDKLFRRGSTEFGEIPLAQLVHDCCELLSKDLEKQRISLEIDVEDNIQILGDHGQIETVVLNLLTNAMDALKNVKHEKIIHVATKSTDQHVSLSIADNGSGMSEAILKQVFDPFFSTKESGMGIGLWLSKSIVEHHNATISASNNEQTGCKFEVTFLQKTATTG